MSNYELSFRAGSVEDAPARRRAMEIEAVTLSFSFSVASVALNAFAYVFYVRANKIGFASAASAAVVLSPVALLGAAFIILVIVFFMFSRSLAFEEEEARRIEIKKFFSYRATGRNVALVAVAVALMILSGIAVGYVFATQTSDASLLAQSIVLHLVMVVFAVLFLAAVIASRKVYFIRNVATEENEENTLAEGSELLSFSVRRT